MIEAYLNLSSELQIIPNFWLSYEYLKNLERAGYIKTVEKDGLIWLEEDEWCIFPPLPKNKDFEIFRQFPTPRSLKIWSDFQNFSIGEALEFLDYEYIYDPSEFWNLSGGKWEVFRKNSRKWKNKNPKHKYITNSELVSTSAIEALLIKWLEANPNTEVHDEESLVYFIFQGKNREFLVRGGDLVGINVWDSFGKYVMYRYCIADPDEPFLSEFLRLILIRSFFLTDKLIIDGGTLGRKGLEKFKDKMNPISKREIYTKIW